MDEPGHAVPDDDDGLPIVGLNRGSNAPLWGGGIVIVLLAIGLFVVMEGRRQRQLEPAIAPTEADAGRIEPYSPPPLNLPDPPAAQPAQLPVAQAAAAPPTAAVPVNIAPQPYYPQPSYQPPALQPPPLPTQSPASNGPPAQQQSAIVYDVSAPDVPPAAANAAAAPAAGQGTNKTPPPAYASRGRASRLTTTVPRGTLIPAVLETALDSTQPGQARALISEDIYNLNRDRVLIPRGSRLFGEYRADVAAGQRRAFIQWNELIRPDGAVIAIESPATDPLGRAGVKGKVNSHFASRFGGALLQSAIDVGTIAGAQAISRNGVFFASPALQAGTSQLVGPQPKPSLSVRQGAKISVLVSRDLEFAPVEPPQ